MRPLLLATVVLCGCPRNDGSDDGSNGDAVQTGLELDTSEHDTEHDTGHDTAVATGEADTSGTAGSTGEACELTDECISDADCPDALQSCIGCICVTDGQAMGDPIYPDPAGGCGEAFDGNTIADPPINSCMPTCDTTAPDIYGACPLPATGTARGACLVTITQDSSNTPCSMDTFGQACPNPGEYCYTADGATFVCRVGGYCLASCSSNETCPDGMTCDDSGRCQY